MEVVGALTAARYSYLPSVGFAFFLDLMFDRLSKKSKLIQNYKFGLGKGWCMVLAFTTINQNTTLANNLKLYNSILKKYPNVAVILNNRVIHKLDNGDQKGALMDYNEAILSDPGYQVAYENRANLFANLNRFEEAFVDYKKSIELQPTAKAYQNRATLYLKNKDYKAAISDLNQAISMDPNYSLAFKNRGLAFILSGQNDLGCADLQNAAKLGKEDAVMLMERFCGPQNR